MTRFWSRALFFKEWKNISWMSVLLTGLLIKQPVYSIMSNLNRIKTDVGEGVLNLQQVSGWFSWMLVRDTGWVLASLFIVFLFVISLFSHNRQGATGDLIASMPFSRQQIIGTKWLAGALAIAIPFGVAFLLLTGLYWTNTNWIDTGYEILPQWAFLGFFFLLTFYTFLFFVQTVMGENAAAGIVGAICTMVPYFLLWTIPAILGEMFNLSYIHPLIRTMERVSAYTFWPSLIKGRADYFAPNWEQPYYFYTHYGSRIGLMVLIILGLYVLSQLAFLKNPLEKNGQLLMFRFLEPILVWGFAVCLGLLMTSLFGLGYGSGNIMLFIYLAAGTVIGYFVAKKTIAYYQK